MTATPRANLHFAPAEVVKTDLPDGGMILSSPLELGAYPKSICDHLEKWAASAPERVFLAERGPDGNWIELAYGKALHEVRRLAQGLLDIGLNIDRPLMILSDNSVDAGLLILAAMYAGVPVAPISPAYSLVSQDHAKLRYIFDLVRPGMVYAQDGVKFAKALAALNLTDVAVTVSTGTIPEIKCTPLAAMGKDPTEALEVAHAAVTPDGIAKILFTSGSTGMPKGVINTQRMMCSNQQAIAQVWPWLEETPPVVIDWLPWNHTFGGNHNFNMVLRNGGSLYIDDGKPVPGLIEKTVRGLRGIAPTMYFNVPRGFDVLLPYLESDEVLCANFFKNLKMIFYAAAALPQPLWERLEKLSVKTKGELVTMLSAWGSTETAPANTSVHFPIDRAGVIGLPLPGTQVKLVSNGGKLEIRVKGPNVMPGYFRDKKQTEAAFDEEGFYCIGDAAKLADPNDPAKGIVFDGRVSEDFKLTTGTWVHVGGLRISAIENAAPYIQDAVVTGHNRDFLGLLAWPNLDACRSLIGNLQASPAEIASHPKVLEAISSGLAKHNSTAKGSSARIERVRLLVEPPNLDANEITDKGYINQRATLERRADLVESLYAEPAPAEVQIL